MKESLLNQKIILKLLEEEEKSLSNLLKIGKTDS
jgi:hypothetical protein